MLDTIFGENNFQNEIVWKRTSSHSGSRKFGPVYDTIFFYCKSRQYTWNPLYSSMITNRKARHDLVADPDGRMFRTSDLTGSGTRNGESGKKWRDYDPTAKGRHWGIPNELSRAIGAEDLSIADRLDALDAAGLMYCPDGDSLPRYKAYVVDDLGMTLGSVWTDIPPINSQAAERIGYPTQKPLTLLQRIIQASSNPGDLMLDAFCGCGTALVAAQNLDRRWIGIDVSPTACRVMAKRLEDECKVRERKDFFVRDMPHSEEFLRRIPPFEFENWAVVALGGIPNSAKVGGMGIDGRIYPVSAVPDRDKAKAQLNFMDHWYPIQVKQKDKAGRPDIDSFEAVMMHEERTKGFFVSFDFTSDAEREINAFFKRTGKAIIPLTVREIIDEEIAMKLA